MTPTSSVTTLFLDIGGVLLTNGWDHVIRTRAAEKFSLDYEEMNERHHLTFDTYEEGKLSLDEYLKRVVFYEYGLNLEDVARIWRGGCSIRAALLEDIQAAFHTHPDLPNLLNDEHLGQAVISNQDNLREVVGLAVSLGLPVPCLMASLAYFDGYRSAWLPANLIQAQRDDFGAHTYERVDAKGVFHTRWE